VNASLVPILARQSYSRLNVLKVQFFSAHFPWFLIAVACLTRPLTKQHFVGFVRRLQSMMPTRNKDKNIWGKKSPFVADFII